MNQRALVVAGAAVVAVVLLLGLIAQDTEIDPSEVDVPEVEAEPAPAEVDVVEVPAPPEPSRGGPLQRPDDVPEGDFPEEAPPPADITPDVKRDMNYAVDDIVRAARDECIVPWIDEIPDPTEAEFVFDAVLWNGVLYDASIRSLNVDIPPTVMDCIRDRVWYQDFPEFALPGEVRLQRNVSYRNEAMMPPQ